MLIDITPADVYEADTVMDIEKNYSKLIGSVVIVKDEMARFVVFPRKDDVGRLIKVP